MASELVRGRRLAELFAGGSSQNSFGVALHPPVNHALLETRSPKPTNKPWLTAQSSPNSESLDPQTLCMPYAQKGSKTLEPQILALQRPWVSLPLPGKDLGLGVVAILMLPRQLASMRIYRFTGLCVSWPFKLAQVSTVSTHGTAISWMSSSMPLLPDQSRHITQTAAHLKTCPLHERPRKQAPSQANREAGLASLYAHGLLLSQNPKTKGIENLIRTLRWLQSHEDDLAVTAHKGGFSAPRLH